jgi:hypothetical protein
VPSAEFITGFVRDWRTGEHLTVLGKTWSGKSWLTRWLLEERWAKNRAFLIDTKAADPLWRVGFQTVDGVPGWLQNQAQRMRGDREWLRVVPPAARAEGRRVVGSFMKVAWRRGSSVVVFDEMRSVAGRPPNLGLAEAAHVLWQRGRAKGITVVGGAQSPVYIPRAALEEIAHLFVGHIADSRRLPLLRDVVGDRGDELVELVRGIKARSYEFVYVPPDGPLQLVKAPASMPGAKPKSSSSVWANSERHRLPYG